MKKKKKKEPGIESHTNNLKNIYFYEKFMQLYL